MLYGEFTPTFLLPVPREALEAILLLHNAQPQETPFTNVEDLAHRRLLETLMNIVNVVNIVSRNLYGSLDRIDVSSREESERKGTLEDVARAESVKGRS
jgi:hypothetical protein